MNNTYSQQEIKISNYIFYHILCIANVALKSKTYMSYFICRANTVKKEKESTQDIFIWFTYPVFLNQDSKGVVLFT